MRRPALVALAVALGACSPEYGNPFAGGATSTPPPPGADLVFAANSHSARPGGLRELFAVDDSGSRLTRLTFCGDGNAPCDILEAAPSNDGQRMVVRKIGADTNVDGRLTPADGTSLHLYDLLRGVSVELVPSAGLVSGVDWSPRADILVYSATNRALSPDGLEDLYRMEANGQAIRNLTCVQFPQLCVQGVRERRPRIDPTGSVAVFERIDPTLKGEIWIFESTTAQIRVTTGGPGTEPLPGTPYVVGSDADPDYSPDGRFIVFRRLVGLGTASRGSWDILTVRPDGTGLTTIATGPGFRGPPAWGPLGIAFNEIADDGISRLVIVNPDGGNRRDPVTFGAGFELNNPRWLR